jgi:hypothetical protein
MIFIHEAPSVVGAARPTRPLIAYRSWVTPPDTDQKKKEEACADCPNRWMCLGVKKKPEGLLQLLLERHFRL